MADQSVTPVRSYKDLRVWREAMALVTASYQLTNGLPGRERFGLASQIQRAVVSIAANIAEGHGRKHTGEYLFHLSVANGSLMEVETEVAICLRLGYIKGETAEPVLSKAAEVGRMLAGLIKKLRMRTRTPDPGPRIP
jgi:four helix bundle protein